MSFNDPYCYPGTDVLINKLNLTDSATLHEKEGVFVGLSLLELYDSPIQGKFDYKHLQEIHRYLFQEIYDWAGKTRTVAMTKYYPEIDQLKGFAQPQYIEPYINDIFRELSQERHLKGITDTTIFAERIAYYMSEVNAAHPFREGNGRSQREFFRCLALERGFNLDWTKVNEMELTKARAKSIDDATDLKQLILDCLTKIPRKNKDLER